MSSRVYVQSMNDFKTNQNKINNLDNKNIINLNNIIINGYFWGFRDSFINKKYFNRDDFIGSLFLIGGKNYGYDIYEINSKIINNENNIFNEVFLYTFGINKLNLHISYKDLNNLLKIKRNIKRIKAQGVFDATYRNNKICGYKKYEIINFCKNKKNFKNIKKEIQKKQKEKKNIESISNNFEQIMINYHNYIEETENLLRLARENIINIYNPLRFF